MNQPARKPAKRPPPKKLVPRPATPEATAEIAAEGAVAAEAASAPVAPVAPLAEPSTTPLAKPPRKPSKVQETVAKHQKLLAEALVKAQAIDYSKPIVAPAPKAGKAKAAKPAKVKKPKLVRDSYAMPEAEYARIAELKKRLAALGSEVKKSELLRGGLALLAALNDAELKAVMGRVERIKTGRPAK